MRFRQRQRLTQRGLLPTVIVARCDHHRIGGRQEPRHQTFLNGRLVSDIVLDTNQVATDTIDCIATDPTGLGVD
jgi:hypothetical protein